MLNKWIKVVKCSDVEPGEIVREAADPHSDQVKQFLVEQVATGRMVFADGSSILESELSAGNYWHEFKNTPW